jgi:hypothetical protein
LFSSSAAPGFVLVVYLVLLGAFPVFAAGDGDAAEAGLAAGLALVAGVLVVLLGADGVAAVDGGVVGDEVVLGEFELFSGSLLHAAANAIVAVARSASAMRLIRFTFGLVIYFFLVRQRLKSRTIIARR